MTLKCVARCADVLVVSEQLEVELQGKGVFLCVRRPKAISHSGGSVIVNRLLV